jgi:hypothetical protein
MNPQPPTPITYMDFLTQAMLTVLDQMKLRTLTEGEKEEFERKLKARLEGTGGSGGGRRTRHHKSKRGHKKHRTTRRR